MKIVVEKDFIGTLLPSLGKPSENHILCCMCDKGNHYQGACSEI